MITEVRLRLSVEAGSKKQLKKFPLLKQGKLTTMTTNNTGAPEISMADILVRQFNLQQIQHDRQIVEEKSASVRLYLDSVPNFTGDYNDVVRFINSIESITGTLNELPQLDQLLRFEQVKNKLQGRARCLLQENPSDWPTLKPLIVRSFSNQLILGTLQDYVEKIKFTQNILTTFNLIQQALSKVLDSIELSSEEETLKCDRIRHSKERAYRHFRSLIPENCKAALNGHLCRDIHAAINVLKQEGLLNELHPSLYGHQGRSNNNLSNFRPNHRDHHNQHSYSQPQQQRYSAPINPRVRENHPGNSRRPDNNFNRHGGHSGQFRQNHFNNNRYDNHSGNSRRSFNNQFNRQNNYPDSGLQRVHEPMETENFCIRASGTRDGNYRLLESKGNTGSPNF